MKNLLKLFLIFIIIVVLALTFSFAGTGCKLTGITETASAAANSGIETSVASPNSEAEAATASSADKTLLKNLAFMYGRAIYLRQQQKSLNRRLV